MSDKDLEQKIVEAGYVAPRVSQKRVESVIETGTFIMLPSGTTMICELLLSNGFRVRGESACIDPANFRKEIGEQISKQKAFDQVWPFEGYLLAQRLHEGRYILSDEELDLPEFHQRLLCERGDLANNMDKLHAWLDGPETSSIPEAALELLNKQYDAQLALLAVLTDRLQLLAE